MLAVAFSGNGEFFLGLKVISGNHLIEILGIAVQWPKIIADIELHREAYTERRGSVVVT